MRGTRCRHVPARPRLPAADELDDRRRLPVPAARPRPLDNSITQHRPIGTGEPTRPRGPGGGPPAPSQGARDLVDRRGAGSAGELVWEETGTILHRGPGAGAPAVRAGPSRCPTTCRRRSQWRLDGDLGRRYAAASGDRNPIHLHRLSARALGFPRAIAHGMWSMARCLAQLEGRTCPPRSRPRPASGSPILLPGTVGFAAVEREGGSPSPFATPGRAGMASPVGPSTFRVGSSPPAESPSSPCQGPKLARKDRVRALRGR